MSYEYRPAPMSLAQRAALRKQAPRTLRQPARRRVWPIVTVIVLLVALVAAVGGFEYYYRGRVFPRVQIPAAGLQVGGLTQQDIVVALRPFALKQRMRSVTFTMPNHAPIVTTARALGYRLDDNNTAVRAYQVGRDGSIPHRVLSQVQLLINGATVDLVQHVDRATLQRYLFRMAAGVDRKPRPGIAGRRLNVGLAVQDLTSQLMQPGGDTTYSVPFLSIPALPVVHPKTPHHPKKRAVKKKPAA
ncbi:MAG TPA: peptidoglycan binding domain-containing protein [Chloroflexota bacterium]|nr:peptidoglycan binding domain-containing protein [Chloroflexota bacterium]